MSSYPVKAFIAALVAISLQGCSTALTKGADRRTDGIYIEDGNIEDTAQARIRKKYQNKVHVNVYSYNRKVLLTGEVPDETAKADMFRIAGTVQNVTDIRNEVVVAFQSGLTDRANDGLIANNIRIRLQSADKPFFNAERIKVAVERNAVYLMGMVNHAEADVAIEIARTSQGVSKVVPLFEYID